MCAYPLSVGCREGEDRLNLLNAIAAVVTVASFFLAAWQHRASRRAIRTERERIALQAERLDTALRAAISNSETADLIVQRAKENDATTAELQNIARILRMNSALLARQLQQEQQLLSGWTFGQLMDSSTSASSDPASSLLPPPTMNGAPD